jgi:hypothetical protein
MQGRSVLDEAIAGSGRVGDPHHELESLQREMSDPDKADDMDRILDRFGHVQEEYEHLGGYALESQARLRLRHPAQGGTLGGEASKTGSSKRPNCEFSPFNISRAACRFLRI